MLPVQAVRPYAHIISALARTKRIHVRAVVSIVVGVVFLSVGAVLFELFVDHCVCAVVVLDCVSVVVRVVIVDGVVGGVVVVFNTATCRC